MLTTVDLPSKVRTIEGDLDGQRRYYPGHVGTVVGCQRTIIPPGPIEYYLIQFDTWHEPVRLQPHEVEVIE